MRLEKRPPTGGSAERTVPPNDVSKRIKKISLEMNQFSKFECLVKERTSNAIKFEKRSKSVCILPC